VILYITAVQMSGSTSHERISSVRWLNCSDGTSNVVPTAGMIEWLEKEGNSARVAGEEKPVAVGVWVTASGKYLRTFANEEWTDNLLSLPRF
jgi:hypothetical protein